MDFETYKRKLLEEDERNHLSELQSKYNGIGTPDYSNMSFREELQTRIDLDELNNLQQKYGVQQAPTPKPQTTAQAPQPSHKQPTSSQQTNPKPQNSFWNITSNKINQMANKFADDTEGAVIAFTQGLSGNNFDELTGKTGASIITGSFYPNSQNISTYNHAYNHIRDDIRTRHTNFKERHPVLNEALEIGGAVLGGVKNPYISATLYGVGSAETPEQIPEEIMYNALGNKYSQKITTDILPKPIEPFAQEYLSRILSGKLKKYINE